MGTLNIVSAMKAIVAQDKGECGEVWAAPLKKEKVLIWAFSTITQNTWAPTGAELAI